MDETSLRAAAESNNFIKIGAALRAGIILHPGQYLGLIRYDPYNGRGAHVSFPEILVYASIGSYSQYSEEFLLKNFKVYEDFFTNRVLVYYERLRIVIYDNVRCHHYEFAAKLAKIYRDTDDLTALFRAGGINSDSIQTFIDTFKKLQ